ncbi:MAG TPA: dephospho-CoA kinase [Vicinamibacteria bacterium]|nr:dephospho-CoA kinase [Vicinamibacteria bacterium]
MLEVGLTGGIACGKSVVRRRFEEKGVATLDADVVVHRLFEPGSEVVRELESVFGAKILTVEGAVDRKALGALVFGDLAARERLNAIVHPHVWLAIDAFFESVRARGEPLAVVDAALMVETGSYERYDCLVVVHCTGEQQMERLMKRDGLTSEEAQRRIEAQMPLEQKKAYADLLIDTSGTLVETLSRTDDVLAALRKLADES